MRNRKISITLLIALSLGFVGILGAINVTTMESNSIQLPGESALMDLTHPNFAMKEAGASVVEPIESPASEQPAEVGDTYVFSVSDDYMGTDYDEDFIVVGEGEHILILITLDAYNSFDGTAYYFANPIGDDSEPWLRTEDAILPEMLDYMVDEFDNVIYPTEAEVYGVPASRPSDPANPEYEDKDKIWTLIFNIRDLAYYDPTATSYIAGYFSLSDSNTNQKNIMHIDTFEWNNRVGDADTPWFDVSDPRARPNLYEGTFAHEYEHMIHADIDPDEPSWVDEGLADLAGFLCGYGHPNGHIMYYLAFHAFTSLTFWGSGLEDYGASYLFQLYLYEKFGGTSFVSDLVHEQANGIEGIVKTLHKHGIWYSFDLIFDWWTIANYLDHPYIWQYGYSTLEMGSGDSNGWTIEYALSGYWGEPIFGNATSQYYGDYFADPEWSLQGWWGVPQPYTAHYYRFVTDKTSYIRLDGEDVSGTPAYSGTYEWYSQADAWAWRSLYQTFTVPATGATLNFMTHFNIEDDWDYGYVEVHDLTTGEWYTLNATGTVDYVAHAQDNPNTPDDREPTAYEAAGRWFAFTGSSGGWVPVSMDLTPFAGDDIDLYFTIWQDGAFTLDNMYVDDISIPELGFFDDVEAGEDGWTTTGWIRTDGIVANGFGTTVLTLNYPVTDPSIPIGYKWAYRMSMNSGTQTGKIQLSASHENEIYLAIVTNHANHILPADYVLSVEHKQYYWWAWW